VDPSLRRLVILMVLLPVLVIPILVIGWLQQRSKSASTVDAYAAAMRQELAKVPAGATLSAWADLRRRLDEARPRFAAADRVMEAATTAAGGEATLPARKELQAARVEFKSRLATALEQMPPAEIDKAADPDLDRWLRESAGWRVSLENVSSPLDEIGAAGPVASRLRDWLGNARARVEACSRAFAALLQSRQTDINGAAVPAGDALLPLAVWDFSSGAFHASQWELPASTRASDPARPFCVVYLVEGSRRFSTYGKSDMPFSTTGTGYQRTRIAHFVTFPDLRRVRSVEIAGDPPPGTVTSSGDHYGHDPTAAQIAAGLR
jgi:hypothetical protein